MEFHAEKPIYRQIIDFVSARIVEGEWPDGSRVPPVRELAARMSVNSHTVLRAYDALQADGIMEVRRGMGYYLTADARERSLQMLRREFIESKAPAFFAEMHRLGLSIEDLTTDSPGI